MLTYAAEAALRAHLAALFPDCSALARGGGGGVHALGGGDLRRGRAPVAAVAARADASWAEEEILVNFVLLLLYAFGSGEVTLGGVREWLLRVMFRFP
jgi:hypothetical protein